VPRRPRIELEGATYVDPWIALELFGDRLDTARASYMAFVAEADPRVRRGQTRA
jgi:hypothetical protein